MVDPMQRRGFLRGLVSLPLIGGSVALIGSPSAVAEPVTLLLLRRYASWLAQEHGRVHDEFLRIAPEAERYWNAERAWGSPMTPIADLVCSHWPQDPVAIAHAQTGAPGDRAALVLSAVGCNWRGDVRCA